MHLALPNMNKFCMTPKQVKPTIKQITAQILYPSITISLGLWYNFICIMPSSATLNSCFGLGYPLSYSHWLFMFSKFLSIICTLQLRLRVIGGFNPSLCLFEATKGGTGLIEKSPSFIRNCVSFSWNY